jgi:hypothetical protein
MSFQAKVIHLDAERLRRNAEIVTVGFSRWLAGRSGGTLSRDPQWADGPGT